MKVLIVRSFPSIVHLNDNSYNFQEIGLATAFMRLGYEASIVYYGVDKDDLSYVTENGKISIHYRKARKFLGISVLDNIKDLVLINDLIITNEYTQIDSYKIVRDFSTKCIVYHGPYYDLYHLKYNIYNFLFDICFLKKIKKSDAVFVTKSELAKDTLTKRGIHVAGAVGVGLNSNQLIKMI